MSQFTTTGGYRALLIPDERLSPDTWDVTDANVTEAGPRPGQAIPQVSGVEAALVVSGSQDDSVYNVYAVKGGFDERAEVCWAKVTSGAVGRLRGMNLPNVLGDNRHVSVGTSNVYTAGAPSTCTTSTGRVVWASTVNETIGGTETVYISYTDDLVTITGPDASIPVISDDSASDYFYGVSFDNTANTALYFDDERDIVQLWVRVVDPLNLQMQYYLFESADDAETWELVQRNCILEVYIASDTLRAPCVKKVNGVTVLLQPEDDGSTTYTLTQFVSVDRGRTLRILANDTTGYMSYAMEVFNGDLYVAAIDATSNDLKIAKMASPYEYIIAASFEAISGLTDESSCALVAVHGRLYVYSINADAYKLSTAASITGEASDFQFYGHGAWSLGSATANVDFSNVAATPAFGGVAVCYKITDTGADAKYKGHVFASRLGGWSTFTMPRSSPPSAYREGQVAWGVGNNSVNTTFYGQTTTTWMPYLAPDDISAGAIWPVSGAGTDAAGLSAGGSPYRSVSCGAGTSRYWTREFACDPADGILAYFDCEVSEGGSTTSDDSATRILISNTSTASYNLVVRLSASGGVWAKDITGGGNTMIAADIVNRHAIVVAMRETDPDTTATATFYSVGYGALDNIQNWEELATITLDADLSSPPAVSSIEFGVIGAGSAVDIEQKWYGYYFIAAEGKLGIYDAAIGNLLGNTNQVRGAPLTKQYVTLEGGTKLSATNGPLKTGEYWQIAPKYDYAKEHVYPRLYPSPRQVWRSTADGSAQTFQWIFDSSDETPEGLGSAVWGAAVIGANFANWKLEGYTAAGAWETILTVDSSDEFTSLPYRAAVRATFTGAYVTVNTGGSGSASRYIHENELAGGTVKIGSTYFKIARNTSGYWSTTAGKKPVLFLESWDPSVASTGTLDIWPPNCLALKTGLGSTEYRKLRFVITASDTADGYYEMGDIVIGPVYLFGKQYSKGRVLTRSSGTVVNYTTGGASNPVVLSPTRRKAEFGWFEGLDQTDIYAASATSEPTYVSTGDATGVAQAAAARHDTPTNLDGLYVRLDGGNVPVVYIPHIPYDATEGQFTTTDGRTINGFVYGRIEGDVKLTTVLGVEQHTEVAQIAAIAINEDV